MFVSDAAIFNERCTTVSLHYSLFDIKLTFCIYNSAHKVGIRFTFRHFPQIISHIVAIFFFFLFFLPKGKLGTHRNYIWQKKKKDLGHDFRKMTILIFFSSIKLIMFLGFVCFFKIDDSPLNITLC